MSSAEIQNKSIPASPVPDVTERDCKPTVVNGSASPVAESNSTLTATNDSTLDAGKNASAPSSPVINAGFTPINKGKGKATADDIKESSTDDLMDADIGAPSAGNQSDEEDFCYPEDPESAREGEYIRFMTKLTVFTEHACKKYHGTDNDRLQEIIEVLEAVTKETERGVKGKGTCYSVKAIRKRLAKEMQRIHEKYDNPELLSNDNFDVINESEEVGESSSSLADGAVAATANATDTAGQQHSTYVDIDTSPYLERIEKRRHALIKVHDSRSTLCKAMRGVYQETLASLHAANTDEDCLRAEAQWETDIKKLEKQHPKKIKKPVSRLPKSPRPGDSSNTKKPAGAAATNGTPVSAVRRQQLRRNIHGHGSEIGQEIPASAANDAGKKRSLVVDVDEEISSGRERKRSKTPENDFDAVPQLDAALRPEEIFYQAMNYVALAIPNTPQIEGLKEHVRAGYGLDMGGRWVPNATRTQSPSAAAADDDNEVCWVQTQRLSTPWVDPTAPGPVIKTEKE